MPAVACATTSAIVLHVIVDFHQLLERKIWRLACLNNTPFIRYKFRHRIGNLWGNVDWNDLCSVFIGVNQVTRMYHHAPDIHWHVNSNDVDIGV